MLHVQPIPDTRGGYMAKLLPAMTIRIEVDGGATVCLAYRGGWHGGPFPPYASVSIHGRPTPLPPEWLEAVLTKAFNVIGLYATSQRHWPADLRPVTIGAAEQLSDGQ
jgi:hypothetical protein